MKKPWRMGLQDSALGAFRGPDGTAWSVEVRATASSNAMVAFLHPDRLARKDRYAWFISHGAAVDDPRQRLEARAVLAQLDDRAMLRLFRKSMAVDSSVPRFEPG
jgi:hypothetical protein